MILLGQRVGLEATAHQRISQDFFDIERIKALEQIVQHYTKLEQPTKSQVIEFAASLSHDPKANQLQPTLVATSRYDQQPADVSTRPTTSGTST